MIAVAAKNRTGRVFMRRGGNTLPAKTATVNQSRAPAMRKPGCPQKSLGDVFIAKDMHKNVFEAIYIVDVRADTHEAESCGERL